MQIVYNRSSGRPCVCVDRKCAQAALSNPSPQQTKTMCDSQALVSPDQRRFIALDSHSPAIYSKAVLLLFAHDLQK